MIGPLKGPQGFPQLPETIRGGARSIKNQAKAFFKKAGRMLTETSEQASMRKVEKLDKKIDKLRGQVEGKPLDKKTEKLAAKLKEAERKRFPTKSTSIPVGPAREGPDFEALKNQYELARRGDEKEQERALILRNTIGQGLLQKRGYNKDSFHTFLDQAFDKFVNDKAFSKEDLGFMLFHIAIVGDEDLKVKANVIQQMVNHYAEAAERRKLKR